MGIVRGSLVTAFSRIGSGAGLALAPKWRSGLVTEMAGETQMANSNIQCTDFVILTGR